MVPAPIRIKRLKQKGVLLIAVSILLVGVATTAAVKQLEYISNQTERNSISHTQQTAKIKTAIAAFVVANRRLPCPANGASDETTTPPTPPTGNEVRDGTGICTSVDPIIADQKTGILPWNTLGLGEQDVLASDLTHYSYRVFSGPTGLTVNGGASMTFCDTDNGPTADVPLLANGQCDTSKNSTSAQFATGKGLAVVTESGNRSDIAYVLIHHGKSNSGAYFQNGKRKAMAANTVIREYANAQGVNQTTFTAIYHATPINDSVSTNDPNYFDDRVEYLGISDLAKSSGLSARNWLDNPVTIESSTLNSGFTSDVDNTVAFTGGSATAGGSVGTTLSTFSDGVGISGGSGGFGKQIRGTDVFTINFLKDYTRIGLVLSGLGQQSTQYEGVTATLRNSSGTTVGTVYLVACGSATNNSTATLVAFDKIASTSAFRTIELRPNVPTSIKDSVGNDVYTDTNFLVNSINICDGSGATCINTAATITASCTFKTN